MDIYSSGKKQQTMLLCNVGHGIQRFQGGVWNVAVVKFNFLCSPIHPTAWLCCKLTLCVGVFIRPLDTG